MSSEKSYYNPRLTEETIKKYKEIKEYQAKVAEVTGEKKHPFTSHFVRRIDFALEKINVLSKQEEGQLQSEKGKSSGISILPKSSS